MPAFTDPPSHRRAFEAAADRTFPPLPRTLWGVCAALCTGVAVVAGANMARSLALGENLFSAAAAAFLSVGAAVSAVRFWHAAVTGRSPWVTAALLVCRAFGSEPRPSGSVSGDSPPHNDAP